MWKYYKEKKKQMVNHINHTGVSDRTAHIKTDHHTPPTFNIIMVTKHMVIKTHCNKNNKPLFKHIDVGVWREVCDRKHEIQ